MKHLVIFISIIGLSFSCVESKKRQKIHQKQNIISLDQYIDSLKHEEEKLINDESQPEFYINQATKFLKKAITDENKSILDSARIQYTIAVNKGIKDEFSIFYCGLLTEKLKGRKAATKYYTKCKKQIFKNSDFNLFIKDEYNMYKRFQPNCNLDSVRGQLINHQFIKQTYVLFLCEIMNGNEKKGIIDYNNKIKNNPDYHFFNSNEVKSREDVLNWVKID